MITELYAIFVVIDNDLTVYSTISHNFNLFKLDLSMAELQVSLKSPDNV